MVKWNELNLVSGEWIMKRRALLFALALLLPAAVLAQDLPSSYIIAGVPAIKQGPNQCGSTCVAMGMNYFGRNVTKDEVFAIVGGPDSNPAVGTVCDRVLDYLRTNGFKTRIYHTSKWEKWKRELVQNHPIMSLGVTHKSNTGHFILIIGYDDNRIVRYRWKPGEEFTGGFLVIDPSVGQQRWYDYDFGIKTFVTTRHPNINRYYMAAIAFWPKDGK